MSHSLSATKTMSIFHSKNSSSSSFLQREQSQNFHLSRKLRRLMIQLHVRLMYRSWPWTATHDARLQPLHHEKELQHQKASSKISNKNMKHTQRKKIIKFILPLPMSDDSSEKQLPHEGQNIGLVQLQLQHERYSKKYMILWLVSNQ